MTRITHFKFFWSYFELVNCFGNGHRLKLADGTCGTWLDLSVQIDPCPVQNGLRTDPTIIEQLSSSAQRRKDLVQSLDCLLLSFSWTSGRTTQRPFSGAFELVFCLLIKYKSKDQTWMFKWGEKTEFLNLKKLRWRERTQH